MTGPDIKMFESLASRGFALIPLVGKVPVEKNWTRWCGERRPFNPRDFIGHNAGVTCGTASGCLVLDLDDIDKFTTASKTNGWEVPKTLTVRTGGGGLHHYFQYPNHGRPTGNLSRKDFGFDVRGVGGQVVAPGSIHPETGRPYVIEVDTQLSPCPGWLLSFYEAKKETPSNGNANGAAGKKTNYGLISFEGILADLATAQPGERNERLNIAAFRAGQLVGGGHLDRGFAESGLREVTRSLGLTEQEYGPTIRSGLGKGSEQPRGPETTNSERPKQGGLDVGDSDCDPVVKPWPTLGEAALHGLAGEFVSLATRSSEASPAAILASFLVRFGIEVGPNPHTYVGDARHEARINAVVVGDTSKSRKGTSLSPVQRIFDFARLLEYQPGAVAYASAKTSPGPLSSGEGLIYAVRDVTNTWQIDKKTVEGQWVMSDPGVEDKRLFVHDEEFASALACTMRHGNTLSMVIRTRFDSGNSEPLTKSNRTKCTAAHVGVITHITAFELGRFLEENQIMNGFGNRFLWVCARRQGFVAFPEPMPAYEVTQVQKRLLKAIEAAQASQRMNLNDGAKALWSEVYPTLSAAKPGLAGSLTARGEALTLRLALIYALLDASSEIGRGHLESALAFWGYCNDSADYLFGGLNTDPELQRVKDALADGPKTASDLYRHFSNHMGKEKLSSNLRTLILNGEVKQERIDTGGRPKTIYTLCEKREESEKSPGATDPQNLNSLNSLNSQDDAGKNEPFEAPSPDQDDDGLSDLWHGDEVPDVDQDGGDDGCG